MGQHITWLLHNSRSVGLILSRWRQERGIRERENKREGEREKKGDEREITDSENGRTKRKSSRTDVKLTTASVKNKIRVWTLGRGGWREEEENGKRGHLLLWIIRPEEGGGENGLITPWEERRGDDYTDQYRNLLQPTWIRASSSIRVFRDDNNRASIFFCWMLVW